MKDELVYEINISWDGKTGAIANFKQNPPLRLDMAKDFGGIGKEYCSDEIFLTALTGCILETFLYIAKKMRINLKDYKVKTDASIKSGRDGYHINKISFNFLIRISKGETEKAKDCYELSIDYCHLRRALNPKIELIFNKQIVED